MSFRRRVSTGHTLCEKCPYSEFFGPYSLWMRENMDQKNSEYKHFSRSDINPLTPGVH